MPKEYKEGDPRLSPPYRSSMPLIGGRTSPNYRHPGQRVIGTRVEEDTYDEEGNLVAIGEMNECSVPHLPYEKWVSQAGNVINLVISTNRDHRQMDANLKHIARGRHSRVGGIPYDYKIARELQLDHTDDEDQWVKYRDQKIKLLRERHDTKMRRFAHIGLSEIEKMRHAGMSADDLAVKATKTRPRKRKAKPDGQAA